MKQAVVILAIVCFLLIGSLIGSFFAMVDMAGVQLQQADKIEKLEQDRRILLKIIEGPSEPDAVPTSTI